MIVKKRSSMHRIETAWASFNQFKCSIQAYMKQHHKPNLINRTNMPTESSNKFSCESIPKLNRFVKWSTCNPSTIRREIHLIDNLSKPYLINIISPCISKNEATIIAPYYQTYNKHKHSRVKSITFKQTNVNLLVSCHSSFWLFADSRFP